MVASDCKNCEKKFPFETIYAWARIAIRTVPNSRVKPSWLLAVARKESGMDPWFYKDEPLFRQNMLTIENTQGVTLKDFTEFFTVMSGPFKGRISKFRFEPSWFASWGPTKGLSYEQRVERIALSCSWGLMQKSAYYLTVKHDADDRLMLLKQFQGDPLMQMIEAVHNLEAAYKADHGDLALMFTDYNGRNRGHSVSEYGRIVSGFETVFSKQLDDAGLSNCLV